MLNPYATGGLCGPYKMMQKTFKMTETLAHGYSSESSQQELSNANMTGFRRFSKIVVLWMKLAISLEA